MAISSFRSTRAALTLPALFTPVFLDPVNFPSDIEYLKQTMMLNLPEIDPNDLDKPEITDTSWLRNGTRIENVTATKRWRATMKSRNEVSFLQRVNSRKEHQWMSCNGRLSLVTTSKRKCYINQFTVWNSVENKRTNIAREHNSLQTYPAFLNQLQIWLSEKETLVLLSTLTLVVTQPKSLHSYKDKSNITAWCNKD